MPLRFCKLAFIVFASVFSFSFASQGIAQDAIEAEVASKETLAQKLVGTWRLEKASTPGSPSGVGSRLKMFTGTHWCIIQPEPATGVVVFHHGGRYDVDGNKVKTMREFAGESTKTMIGGNKTLTIEIEGDTMKQMDADGVFNETWKRVK